MLLSYMLETVHEMLLIIRSFLLQLNVNAEKWLRTKAEIICATYQYKAALALLHSTTISCEVLFHL